MRITVVIPTIAGRSGYLSSAIDTCLTQDDPDLEILVSDNSTGEAREVCAKKGDSRIRYVRPDRYLSMSQHWNFALSHVRSDMMTIIGDDDGIMPGGLRGVRQIVDEFGLVPIHHSLANFHWPDVVDQNVAGTVRFFHPVSDRIELRTSVDFLNSVVRGRGLYLDGPMVYHHFAPTALVRRLSRDGVFFRRTAPDVYSGVAIAANVESYVSTGRLLTLSGQGQRSNGRRVQEGREEGDEFFREAEQSDLLRPRFESRTVQMMLADSILEVAEEFDRPELLAEFDLGYQLWLALLESSKLPSRRVRREESMKLLRIAAANRVVPVSLPRLGRAVRSKVVKRWFTDSSFLPPKTYKLSSSATDIAAAAEELDGHLRLGALG